MEEKKLTQDEIFEQEENCLKAIRTVRKAIFMRMVVTALMIWIVLRNAGQPLVWGLAAFVLLITVMGALPLIQEYRKQCQKRNALIQMEE